jgi:hypothetical protein
LLDRPFCHCKCVFERNLLFLHSVKDFAPTAS